MKSAGKILSALVSAAALGPTDAAAVYLDPDGLGQALIYPYYTVRSVQGNAFNTYLSVVNTTVKAKVIRVRAREGRNGRETLNFNLYLAPNDVWTAGLIPDGAEGAKLVSADEACTNPPMSPSSIQGLTELALSNASFSGASSDGLGDGLDRVREGYVEMIEMATLRTESAPYGAVVQVNGLPDDCRVVQGASVPLTGAIESPTGGLMGTLTLINVASGMDFTVNAEALASLSTQPFYRNFDSPYPDFDAAEVTPVSELMVGSKRYRLAWNRGVDAVSSVLMQTATANEYVLDYASDSSSDWAVTMPTRRFHVTSAGATPPFSANVGQPGCERIDGDVLDRETRWHPLHDDPCESLGCNLSPPSTLCYASTVWSVSRTPSGGRPPRPLLGSSNPANIRGIAEYFQNGWARIHYPGAGATSTGLVSLASSTSVDLRNGASTSGTFKVLGLPAVGFMLRTFMNGTLTCAAARCQGNYGSAFPHKPVRTVVPAP